MRSGLLSTAEVSTMLKVNESTVKRWTDKGSLKCIKTPGGHRKYKMKDVVEFMDTFAYDVSELLAPGKEQLSAITVSTDYAILSKDYDVLAEMLYNNVLEGNRENTFQFLSLLYANRISQTDIFDRILFPAFFRIGVKWMNGEIGVEQEHLASNTAMHAVMKLQEHVVKKPKHGGIALLGCLEEEYHEMGIACVNAVLEAGGWSTYYLGANVPTESFIDAVENYVPDLICVSSLTPRSKRWLVEQCGALRETALIIGAKLVVGGAAASDALKKKVPADFVPSSIAELNEYAAALPRKNAPARA
ncbi:MAG: helix-turn-helix domain-containing protein [Bacteroidetes bacterium]|nr:MAG: helix-turn-helix domain-containing protein [Bacteroidota bacterium]